MLGRHGYHNVPRHNGLVIPAAGSCQTMPARAPATGWRDGSHGVCAALLRWRVRPSGDPLRPAFATPPAPRPATFYLHSSEKLRNVRTPTTAASAPTRASVGSAATVRTMSAATRSSSPSKIARPSLRRYVRCASSRVRRASDNAKAVPHRAGCDHHHTGGLEHHSDDINRTAKRHALAPGGEGRVISRVATMPLVRHVARGRTRRARPPAPRTSQLHTSQARYRQRARTPLIRRSAHRQPH